MKKHTVQEYRWSDLMLDQVVPVFVMEHTGNKASITAFCGTAFFIGQNGYALTAKHNLPEKPPKNLAISFLITDKTGMHEKRRSAFIVDIDYHPTADIAIIKTGIQAWHSIFQLNIKKQCPNARYHLTGYPLAAAKEWAKRPENRQSACIGYNAGHIRGYFIDKSGENTPAAAFYELSKTGGAGVSGSPVFKKAGNTFEVIGIYIGEKKAALQSSEETPENPEETTEESTLISLETTTDISGMAVPASSFYNWEPKCLGHSILKEMNG
ncbi:MAG: serine protease [Oxalobacter formigenes]|nr:serine protease [Oxalobacter formigenes]